MKNLKVQLQWKDKVQKRKSLDLPSEMYWTTNKNSASISTRLLLNRKLYPVKKNKTNLIWIFLPLLEVHQEIFLSLYRLQVVEVLWKLINLENWIWVNLEIYLVCIRQNNWNNCKVVITYNFKKLGLLMKALVVFNLIILKGRLRLYTNWIDR